MEQTWTHIEAAGSDWRRQAACTSRDPELFFPIDTVGPALTQVELARSVCQRCEVRTACLDWALKAGANHGVWDGLSEDERRARYAPTRTAGTHHPLNHPRDALRDDIGRQVGNRFAGRAPHEILRHVTQRHPCRLASPPENLDYIEAQQLFPEALAPVYEATRRLMLGLGDDVVEQFSRTQVSFGSTRKFAWLTPVTKTKALLVIDL